ncbi:MAG: DUF3416 domain-containing protein, partial [Methylobacteriaceae bacterium]|nr:DUF3416 domain-containing protein [Methylobacteriaceae bacterium]
MTALSTPPAQARSVPAPPGLASTTLARPTGPRIYNLFPLLVGTVRAWSAELPRIAAMGFDWVYVNPFHEAGFSGSLYATKDIARLDGRFRDEGAGSDDDQIRAFVAEAERHGLRVMTDLVINHASKDAVLATERRDVFVRYPSGELASPYAVDPDDPSKRTVWGDLAELDYESREAREFLTGYWDRYLARMQGLGVAGFRCDAAYKVPPEVWRALIGPAKARDPSCLFAAETLGCTFEEARATAGAGFDYLFNSFAWWDFRKSWALESYERLRLLGPSIAFPENHDTDRVAAGLPADDPAAIRRALVLRYALAAFFSSGVLMPFGYEWGYRRKVHVVETHPGWREHETGLDLSEDIGRWNRLKAELLPANVEGAEIRLSAVDAPVLALLRVDAGHLAAAREAVLILANPGEEAAALRPGEILARTGGVFGPFLDRTPDAVPVAFEPGGEDILLAPGEVRVLSAASLLSGERGMPAPAAGPGPKGEDRVVVEAVAPELDGGLTPIKRVVGETVEVSADIFSDGHDKIAAEILYRPEGSAEWRRAPMRFVDNDRWSGRFALDRIGRHVFAIEAWRDPFASWLHEIHAKRDAGVDVRLETIEGVQIAEQAARHAEATADGPALAALLDALARAEGDTEGRLALLLDPPHCRLIARHAERVNLSRYPRELTVIADRLAAQFSAWYELFPRSTSGDPNRHGTFDDVVRHLPYVKEMGFDVLYFPPIHPIGRRNRKGKNNALTAEPGDVGSVYAIGDETGGHDAVHPDLGGIEAFRRMVDAAHAHGLEIALDFAVQCSPDHPWIKQHPEWFEYRPDGTMKYAENPPKKYEDIYNVHFYGASLPPLWYALRDAVLFWCRERVRIFRVDNPHT